MASECVRGDGATGGGRVGGPAGAWWVAGGARLGIAKLGETRDRFVILILLTENHHHMT